MNWLICRTADFTQTEYDAVYDDLSDSRKAHIDTFRHALARQQSLAGELALRKLLRQCAIADIPVRLPSGQPALARGSAYVSISHCEDLVACALSREPIGIDAERIRPVKPGLIDRVCTPEEKDYVQDSAERFFEVWTAKEACFKMLGTGITDFQSVNTLTLPRHLIREGDYCIQLVYKEKR